MPKETIIMLAVLTVPLLAIPLACLTFRYWKSGLVFTAGFLLHAVFLWIDPPGVSTNGIGWLLVLLFVVCPIYAAGGLFWTIGYIHHAKRQYEDF